MKSSFKVLFVALVCLILAITVQTNSSKVINDNKIYIVRDKEKNKNIQNIGERINTKGYVNFMKYTSDLSNNMYIFNKRVISLSPDNKSAFVIEKGKNLDIGDILKGQISININLFEINLKTGNKKLVAENIPFISTIKWNRNGDTVGFCGGNRLLIYDYINHSLLYDSRIKSEEVAYFGWSPNGKKVYTEHPKIANGSILYIDSGKILSPYEVKDDEYYKGMLDKNYYYITKSDIDQNIYGQTCIVDYRGNIIKTIPEYGIFRDQYKRSVIEVGEYKFGLRYYKDINDMKNSKLLTREYVYDAKFVYGGCIAYIVKNPNVESNKFLLCIADSNGSIIQKVSVAGSDFAISADGTEGYISSPNLTRIDFINLSLNEYLNDNIKYKGDYSIIKTLRGAIETYYNNSMTGRKDYKSLKKYFINSSAPDQWAYLDMENKWNGQSPEFYGNSDSKYNIEAKVHNINIYKDKANKYYASCNIESVANDSTGNNEIVSTVLELINENGRWYVTGMSTFPQSSVTQNIKILAQNFMDQAKKEKLFNGVVCGKHLTIGQMQFWSNNNGEIHMTNNPATADYCKVLFKEKKNRGTRIYVMLLTKDYNQKDTEFWKLDNIDTQKTLWPF